MPTYYSPAMAAFPPRSARGRPRPGSLERPVNGRLYRGTWLLVGLPLLVLAFSISKPAPLPAPAPALPPSFDTTSATGLANELSTLSPDRSPGSLGARNAARWFAGALAPYGFRVRHDRFSAEIPSRGRFQLDNLSAVAPGRSPQAIVVTAHIDDTGAGAGSVDNASGVAALVEIARSYANPSHGASVTPTHTLVFLATDGGAFGGLGADHFAHAYRGGIIAVVNLDALAASGPPRLVLTGSEPRSPAAELVETAAARIVEQTGRRPERASLLGQLVDLAFPFSLYEQAPYVGRGIPAVTITAAGERPFPATEDRPGKLDPVRLGQLGRASQSLIAYVDASSDLAQGTSSYLYLDARIIRGWAVELVLIAMLLPFLIVAVDLFARGRRRHISIAPALRSYRSRLGFWLWVGGVFELFSLLGVWPGGAALPVSLETPAAGSWPLLGLFLLVVLACVGWIVSRDRLLPRRVVSETEELAGHTAALLVLGVIALLVVATNPFALIFVLPSLHAWLWLPQLRARSPWLRLGVLAAGFLGPLLLIGSFAFRFGLGLDAPWYLAELTSLGYVRLPVLVIALSWLAVSGQLAALAVSRYAPYPSAEERPPRGPIRNVIRRLVLAGRSRKHASEGAQQALEG